MENDNLKKDLNIDVDNVDKEVINQPMRYMRYAELYASAYTESKKVKEAISVLEAELSLEYRTKLTTEGVKFTENIINSYIKSDKRYKTAMDDYIQKIENEKILQGIVESFAQRKSAIENYIKLYLSGFFSDVKQNKCDEEQLNHLNSIK